LFAIFPHAIIDLKEGVILSDIVSQLQLSDLIDILAIAVSTLVGIISIVIATLTLRQNNKMIEESTRPYITIYSGITYFQRAKFYVILKNFGNSLETRVQ
jgi:hypothetical protein